MTMNVFVIRHGQSMANLERRLAGWAQVPLSELGRQQAMAAAECLKDIPFDRVYCSDLIRAQETCRLALPGYEPVLTPALREVSVGSLSNRLIGDCLAEYGDAFLAHEQQQDFSSYGGESPAMIAERIHAFARELEKLEGVHNVALVGHEGTMHRMLTYALGADMPLERLRVRNASIAQFLYRDGIWKLAAWNFTGQLLVED